VFLFSFVRRIEILVKRALDLKAIKIEMNIDKKQIQELFLKIINKNRLHLTGNPCSEID
jgi:hypothetical protein